MPFGTVALERCLYAITIIQTGHIYSLWQRIDLAEAEEIVCKSLVTYSFYATDVLGCRGSTTLKSLGIVIQLAFSVLGALNVGMWHLRSLQSIPETYI